MCSKVCSAFDFDSIEWHDHWFLFFLFFRDTINHVSVHVLFSFHIHLSYCSNRNSTNQLQFLLLNAFETCRFYITFHSRFFFSHSSFRLITTYWNRAFIAEYTTLTFICPFRYRVLHSLINRFFQHHHGQCTSRISRNKTESNTKSCFDHRNHRSSRLP